jgi:aspartyl-tRNA(Asn)/glutamyl-tRNA(Gln) amidotransferase subunit A
MSDILSLSLAEVAAAIRTKKLSSVEATRACLERLHHIQPKTNCVISFEDDEALKAARAADRMRGKSARLGPLHGVPLAHKDMLPQGASRQAARRFRDYRPGITAVVERIQRAGAVWLGNSTWRSLLLIPPGTTIFGHCRNPWNTAHHWRLVELLGRRAAARVLWVSGPIRAARCVCLPLPTASSD